MKNKINLKNRSYCFEIFGYDFMLDYELNPWLIEINTNPCIEESSPLLKMLIPRMLDDAFKLTIDCIFKLEKTINKLHYHVDDYDDSFNMWKYLVSI